MLDLHGVVQVALQEGLIRGVALGADPCHELFKCLPQLLVGPDMSGRSDGIMAPDLLDERGLGHRLFRDDEPDLPGEVLGVDRGEDTVINRHHGPADCREDILLLHGLDQLTDDAGHVGDGACVDDAAVSEGRDLFDGGEGFLAGA